MPKSFVLIRFLAVSVIAAVSAHPAAAVEIPEASWDFHKAETAIQEGNYEKGVPLLRHLAEEGGASAQWLLGGLYMSGTGVHQDTAVGAMWYQKALAEVPATIPVNPPEPGPTFHDDWNFLVLHLGRLRIMCPQITAALGALYFKGVDVPKDGVKSYMWFELAKHYGHPKAAVVQEYVGEDLTEDQIAEAEDRAAKWLAKHRKFDDTLVRKFLPN